MYFPGIPTCFEGLGGLLSSHEVREFLSGVSQICRLHVAWVVPERVRKMCTKCKVNRIKN